MLIQTAADRAPDAARFSRRSALRLTLGAAAALPLLSPEQAAAFQRTIYFSGGDRRDATIKAALRGRNEARLRFDAFAGDRLRVEVAIRGAEARFNVWAPATRRAMWIGARSKTPYRFDGRLEKSGTHEVQVFLVGAAARGSEEHPLSIRVRLNGGVS